jgi:hypothetical protein
MRKILLVAVLVLCAVPAFAQSNCTLTFQTENLPLFTVGQHANFQIEAVSGTPPYRFEQSGGTLPAGLKLKPNGTIKGTPTEPADTVVYVTLSDAAGCTITQAYSIYVEP